MKLNNVTRTFSFKDNFVGVLILKTDTKLFTNPRHHALKTLFMTYEVN